MHSTTAPRIRDHPRSRGVYGRKSLSLATLLGSSPLARGLPHMSIDPMAALRIIPARAGFTRDWMPRRWRLSDHPRSRGVYEFPSIPAAWGAGSSPLARGLHQMYNAIMANGGIIPARAGFTGSGSQAGGHEADHPRSRGVYRASFFSDIAHEGSSPLARGLPGRDYGHPERTRIIPARAGFTWKAPRASLGPPDHPRSRGVYRRSRRQR